MDQADGAAVDHGLDHMAGVGEGDTAAIVETVDTSGRHTHAPVRPEHAFGRALDMAERLAKEIARDLRPSAGRNQFRACDRRDRRLEQDRARWRQLDAAARAGKQHETEPILDFLDLIADCRRRQPHIVGRAGEIICARP